MGLVVSVAFVGLLCCWLLSLLFLVLLVIFGLHTTNRNSSSIRPLCALSRSLLRPSRGQGPKKPTSYSFRRPLDGILLCAMGCNAPLASMTFFDRRSVIEDGS